MHTLKFFLKNHDVIFNKYILLEFKVKLYIYIYLKNDNLLI